LVVRQTSDSVCCGDRPGAFRFGGFSFEGSLRDHSLALFFWNKFTMHKSMKTFLLILVTTAGSNASAQNPRYDLVLKGGHVIDPANHLDGKFDVAVSGGKITAIGKDIPASQAGKIVDVSDLFVTPGLVDIHTHIGHGGTPLNWFAPDARAHIKPIGVPADIALQSGVTTIV